VDALGANKNNEKVRFKNENPKHEETFEKLIIYLFFSVLPKW